MNIEYAIGRKRQIRHTYKYEGSYNSFALKQLCYFPNKVFLKVWNSIFLIPVAGLGVSGSHRCESAEGTMGDSGGKMGGHWSEDEDRRGKPFLTEILKYKFKYKWEETIEKTNNREGKVLQKVKLNYFKLKTNIIV